MSKDHADWIREGNWAADFVASPELLKEQYMSLRRTRSVVITALTFRSTSVNPCMLDFSSLKRY